MFSKKRPRLGGDFLYPQQGRTGSIQDFNREMKKITENSQNCNISVDISVHRYTLHRYTISTQVYYTRQWASILCSAGSIPLLAQAHLILLNAIYTCTHV